jgi:hypothetical protein
MCSTADGRRCSGRDIDRRQWNSGGPPPLSTAIDTSDTKDPAAWVDLSGSCRRLLDDFRLTAFDVLAMMAARFVATNGYMIG